MASQVELGLVTDYTANRKGNEENRRPRRHKGMQGKGSFPQVANLRQLYSTSSSFSNVWFNMYWQYGSSMLVKANPPFLGCTSASLRSIWQAWLFVPECPKSIPVFIKPIQFDQL